MNSDKEVRPSAEKGRDARHLRCGSCGERALHFIVLYGFDVPACLRHLNVWKSPEFNDDETLTEYGIDRGVGTGRVCEGMSHPQAQAWLYTDLQLGFGPHVHIVKRTRRVSPWSEWTRVTSPADRSES